jgi:hypothetical protein
VSGLVGSLSAPLHALRSSRDPPPSSSVAAVAQLASDDLAQVRGVRSEDTRVCQQEPLRCLGARHTHTRTARCHMFSLVLTVYLVCVQLAAAEAAAAREAAALSAVAAEVARVAGGDDDDDDDADTVDFCSYSLSEWAQLQVGLARLNSPLNCERPIEIPIETPPPASRRGVRRRRRVWWRRRHRCHSCLAALLRSP